MKDSEKLSKPSTPFKDLFHQIDGRRNTNQGVKNAIKATNSKIDVWISVATKAYLAITCHYIDDWDMKSVYFTTMPLVDRHTASSIAEWLEDVAARFEIPPRKMIAIVHDNGANIVAAAKILEERHGWSSVRSTGYTGDQFCIEAFKH